MIDYEHIDNLVRQYYCDKPYISRPERFNISASEKKLREIINQFIDLQIKYSKIIPPMITRNYEVVYNDTRNITSKDNIGNYVINKITCEEEVKRYYNDIYNALMTLNKDEVLYFTESLYLGKSDNEIADKKKRSLYNIRKIKSSCIIKLAEYFKVLVWK